MSPGVVQVRADICHDCPTPCARQRDASAFADPCAACPLNRWSPWDCRGDAVSAPTPPAPGDALAAQIETHVLTPLEQALPSAASIVEAVRRCGGCTHARHQLGSTTAHPDPGLVL